jgi:hypothetical protein
MLSSGLPSSIDSLAFIPLQEHPYLSYLILLAFISLSSLESLSVFSWSCQTRHSTSSSARAMQNLKAGLTHFIKYWQTSNHPVQPINSNKIGIFTHIYHTPNTHKKKEEKRKRFQLL